MNSPLPHSEASALLALYDAQLRGVAEFDDAPEIVRCGPLYMASFALRRKGFISYESLESADPKQLIDAAIKHFSADTRLNKFEWKTRGHDSPANLLELLKKRGFKLEEHETVMAGSVEGIIVADSGLANGFTLHRAETAAELREAEHLASEVFGDIPEDAASRADALVEQWKKDSQGFEMWFVRNSSGEVVCSGRIHFVPNTDFASLWGGACQESYRGKGLYRALTAARARAAQARGKKYLHSDCTDYSRPILQRAGLLPITTTTPAIYTFNR